MITARYETLRTLLPDPMRPTLLSLLITLLWCLPALAAAGDPPPLRVDPADIGAQREAIEADLAANERYREISAEDRHAVLRALDLLDEALGEGQDHATLDPARRASIAAAAEHANSLLAAAAADSRMICSRERPIGTRMAVNVCRTVADRRRSREQAQGLSRGERPGEPVDGGR
jgi:hypothetical protein